MVTFVPTYKITKSEAILHSSPRWATELINKFEFSKEVIIMYKVLRIIDYDFTRAIIMESIKSGQTYKVFDDTNLTGDDQFAFVEPQKVYDCKIGILGDVDPSGESFEVVAEEHIGKMNLFKLFNTYGDCFYFLASSSMEIGCGTKVHVKRYDLLAVDGVIHDLTI